MSDEAMKPFADDATAMSIGELSIENGTSAIAVFGNLEISRDLRGLESAKELAQFFARVVETLETEDLPATLEAPRDEGGTIDNPFA